MSLRKSTVIECVASTSDRDITNEVLDLDGADISPLLEGRGFVNADHRQGFDSLLGRVMEAKKITKMEDCTTPTQIKYWQELQRPFLWTKAELWDGVGHKEADSVASIYKFYSAKNEAPPIKVSVEGKTIQRGPDGKLSKTQIRGIALTIAPCNRNTRTEVTAINKSVGADDSLIKSEDYEVPFFREQSVEPLQKIYQLAVTARELLREARISLSKADSGIVLLKSPVLLERLKLMISDYKKSDL